MLYAFVTMLAAFVGELAFMSRGTHPAPAACKLDSMSHALLIVRAGSRIRVCLLHHGGGQNAWIKSLFSLRAQEDALPAGLSHKERRTQAGGADPGKLMNHTTKKEGPKLVELTRAS
jgi:hypothetical protein